MNTHGYGVLSRVTGLLVLIALFIASGSLPLARAADRQGRSPGTEHIRTGLSVPSSLSPVWHASTKAAPKIAAANVITSTLHEPRHSPTVLLADGRVMVAGGDSSLSGYNTTSAEIYNPATNTWTSVAPLNHGRSRHTATRLLNGKVLVAGGVNANTCVTDVTTELYDPGNNTWSYTGNLPQPRIWHIMVLLDNGRVLLAGGDDWCGTHLRASALYDPNTGVWTPTGNMVADRARFGAVKLRDGRVLVAGGWDISLNYYSSAEIYDPSTGTWSATGNMLTSRIDGSLTLLADGRAMIVGGSSGSDSNPTPNVSVEIYNPATGTWSSTGGLTVARMTQPHLLTDGRVVVAGGWGVTTALSSVEAWNPATGVWTFTVPLSAPRYAPSVLLTNGYLMMAGGSDSAGYMNTSEWYWPYAIPTLSVTPPPKTNIGSLVYIPISLTNVLTITDLHGAQIGVRVSNTAILTPAIGLSPRMGNLFPSNSLTYSVALTNGWDFMLTATLPPTGAISGTGVIVSFPFYARAEGCVGLSFAVHRLTDGNAQLISHQTADGQLCVVDQGHLTGTLYLQSRATGHFTNTLAVLTGTWGSYTTTVNAAGEYTFTDIHSGTYTAHFTHPLFVQATRPVTVTRQITTTIPTVGLWAGDMNQDGDVDEPDWYVCAAASIPVEDLAFDINDDHATDIRDCTVLGNNIGQPNMPTTNPPRTSLMAAVQSASNLTASSAGRVVAAPLGNGNTLLRVEGVSERLYAAGMRLGLPAGAMVTSVELRDGFTSGFLRWHQDNDNLYIVAAPREDDALMRDTDIALIHITGGDEVVIEAANPIEAKVKRYIFLSIVKRN